MAQTVRQINQTPGFSHNDNDFINTGRRPTLRLSAGISHEEVLGVSGEIALPLYVDQTQAGLIQAVEAGLNLTYLAEPDMPCPPDGTINPDTPCPEGIEAIPHVTANLLFRQIGRVSLRVGVGGGVAFGGSVEPVGFGGTGVESRTAAAVAYGAALDVAVTPRVSLFGQYRRFSIFTGEREFTTPNGVLTVDVGTETASLLSAGIGIRF